MTSIAVVGIGLLYADSSDPLTFWHHIVKGDDLTTQIPPDHWSIADYYKPENNLSVGTYSKRGSFISPTPFNLLEFGIMPDRLSSISATQLLSLIVAKQVLMDTTAGQYNNMDLSRVGIILGATSVQETVIQAGTLCQWPIWEKAMREAHLSEHDIKEISKSIQSAYPEWTESTFPGFLSNIIPGRIANRFNLGGLNMAVDAACASSLAAIDIAIDALNSGKTDMMLAGGADTANDIVTYVSFSKTPALSPSDDCRPFSQNADGILLGEGIGIIALKRLDDAIRDGNSIYALINGVGSASDGRVKSIYAPHENGQYLALKRCYAAAHVDPATISLIEAHGTATKVGDSIEIQALLKLFDKEQRPKHPIALGSIKSQIGHTKAAAGAAGIIKIILALYHQILPPSIKCDIPNPLLQKDKVPFYVPSTARPWFQGQTPRRASVSAFGFGGINYHITLEEYSQKNAPRYAFPGKKTTLFFSGHNPQELLSDLKNAAELLSKTTLLTLAKNSQTAKHKKLKFAIVAEDISTAQQKIAQAITHLQQNPKKTIQSEGLYYHPLSTTGKIAFLFPGEGSQYLNMGLQASLSFYPLKQLWDTVTPFMLDENLSCESLIFPQHANKKQKELDDARIMQTQYAQVSITAASLVYQQFLRNLGIIPDYLLGHSVGELSALSAGGVFSISDALQIAQLRATCMQTHLMDNSSMLVVRASYPALLPIIEDNNCAVEVAHFNGLDETVLSGQHDALGKFGHLLKHYGIEHEKSPVPHALHCKKSQAASKNFLKNIKPLPFQSPTTPIICGTNALSYTSDLNKIKNLLANQIHLPIQFLQSAATLFSQGVRTFIEVGPNNVLSTILERDYADKKVHIISCDKKSDPDWLHETLAHFFALGLPCDFNTLWENTLTEFPYRYDQDSEAGVVYINGACYGKNARQYQPAIEISKPVSQKNEIELSENTEQKDNSTTIKPEKNVLSHTVLQSLVEEQIAYQDHLLAAHQSFLSTVEHMLEKESMAETTGKIKLPVLPKIFTEPTTPVTSTKSTPIETPIISPVVPALDITTSLNSNLSNKEALVIQLISEKTGYDPSLLDIDMDLESDLGIDSLRRVEILSVLKNTDPDAENMITDLSPEQLLSIRTLRDISNLMENTKKKVLTLNPEPIAIDKTIHKIQEQTPASDYTRYILHDSEQAYHALPLEQISPTSDIVWIYPAGTHLDALFKKYLEKKGWQVQLQTEKPIDVGILIIMPVVKFESINEVIQWSCDLFECIQSCWSTINSQYGRVAILEDTFSSQHSFGGLALIQTIRQESTHIDARYININIKAFNQKKLLEIWYNQVFGSGQRDLILKSPTLTIQSQLLASPIKTVTKKTPSNKSVFLVIGGGRGITAACIIALAQNTPSTFVIFGRTERKISNSQWDGINELSSAIKLLSEEAKSTGEKITPIALQNRAKKIIYANELNNNIIQLEKTGSQILYYSIDILDNAAIKKTLKKVQSITGPITSLIYGAGIIHDKYIVEKKKNDFLEVIKTKILGLTHILNNLDKNLLRKVLLFSSIAGYYGNRGQSDYAIANQMLNNMADSLSKTGLSISTILWPAWESGMASEALQTLFKQHHIEPLTIKIGIRYFSNEFTTTQANTTRVMYTSPALTRYFTSLSFILDPKKERWLYDHCPLWSVPVAPMMYLIDIMSRAVNIWAPGSVIIDIQDAKVDHWVVVDQPTTLIAQQSDYQNNTFQVILKNEQGDSVASAAICVSTAYEKPVEKKSNTQFENTVPLENPYQSHALFHGKSFQLIKQLTLASNGGYAQIKANSLYAPAGIINMPLLDASLQTMLQDSMRHWMNNTKKEWLWFPAYLPCMKFYGPSPIEGLVDCYTSYEGLAFDNTRFPKFHLKLYHNDNLWLEYDFIAAGFPLFKPHMTFSDFYSFYAKKMYLAEMLLSSESDSKTILSEDDVAKNNWLPHHLSCIYALPVTENLADLTRCIAIKEHFSRLFKIHPCEVIIENPHTVSIAENKYDFFMQHKNNIVSISSQNLNSITKKSPSPEYLKYCNWHEPLDIIKEEQLFARLPALSYQSLGAASFSHTHGVKMPYVIGEMANGIAGVKLVSAAAKGGILSFLGTAGLPLDLVEQHLLSIKEVLRAEDPFGANIIHHVSDAQYGEKIVDIYLSHDVTKASASAFMDLSPALVRYALSGLRINSHGELVRKNHLFAKLSRPELARKFLSPAPYEILCALRDTGKIDPTIFECAQKIPIACDITVEADSGGHTDNRPLIDLFPTILKLAEELSSAYGIPCETRIGAAGGIATPESVYAAFALGADYVLTGTINQASVEADQSTLVKRMLARAALIDVAMAPAADMFEQGIKVQVLKRDTLFPMRAQELYRLYMTYDAIDDLPTATLEKIERTLFQQSLTSVWKACETFFSNTAPEEIIRAQSSPKYKMALIFRWYLGLSSKWAMRGVEKRIADYQIWCGPAMGAFNNWVQGSALEPIENRHVVNIAYALIEGALTLKRLHQAKSSGVYLSHTDFNIHPTLNSIHKGENNAAPL